MLKNVEFVTYKNSADQLLDSNVSPVLRKRGEGKGHCKFCIQQKFKEL